MTDVEALTNSNRLPIVAGCCYDVFAASAFATSFIFNPNGGAIGYFAQTHLAWANAMANYRRVQFRQTFSDSVRTLGDMWLYTEEEFVRTFPWSPGPSNPSRQTALQSMLIGDPGLRLPNRTQAADKPVAVLPNEIRLEPNYPNPFNSATQLSYNLSRSAQVTVRIYDVLGREVAVLVDGRESAGTHYAVWEANGVASGLYFAVLQAENVRQTQKMVLLK